jgi:hypothetical protein
MREVNTRNQCVNHSNEIPPDRRSRNSTIIADTHDHEVVGYLTIEKLTNDVEFVH